MLPLTMACGGNEETSYRARYELEGLEVFAYDHDIVCGGLLQHLEAENLRIQELIGAPSTYPVEVHLGHRATELICQVDLDVDGCAARIQEVNFAVGPTRSIAHELVHAQRQQISEWRKPSFLEEGLAETASIGPLHGLNALSSRTRDLASALELDVRDMELEDRLDAAHFVYWLSEAFGWDATIAMFSDESDDAVAVVEKHFGDSLTSLRQRWNDETEAEVRVAAACDHVPILELRDEGLDFEVEMDCSLPTVTGPSSLDGVELMSSRVCFDVVDGTHTTVHVEGEAGVTNLRLQPLTGTCSTVEGFPTASREKRISSDAPADAVFGACRWRADIDTELNHPGSVRVRIIPADPG